jgi:hypothetical protein
MIVVIIHGCSLGWAIGEAAVLAGKAALPGGLARFVIPISPRVRPSEKPRWISAVTRSPARMKLRAISWTEARCPPGGGGPLRFVGGGLDISHLTLRSLAGCVITEENLCYRNE